ncbi:flagellar protein FlaG [Treponema parvum]|uniref:Flagellar protein FlaG n=1 Tax=Treponema parvum TaxID=138851 RepID=A0A975IC83_9SPIR|nr:flagellar protein FlaG [Treponema parvum]QTQ11640.1 flagellar protein FlaG [Treponema parvum]
MNTISNIGQSLAKEGRINYNPASIATKAMPIENITVGASQVIDNIVENNANIEKDVQQLQRLSDMVMGRKLQFNVNNELGSVIIKIVDPNTEQVIKEIPSADIQKLKIRIRKAIGLLFDEMI